MICGWNCFRAVHYTLIPRKKNHPTRSSIRNSSLCSKCMTTPGNLAVGNYITILVRGYCKEQRFPLFWSDRSGNFSLKTACKFTEQLCIGPLMKLPEAARTIHVTEIPGCMLTSNVSDTRLSRLFSVLLQFEACSACTVGDQRPQPQSVNSNSCKPSRATRTLSQSFYYACCHPVVGIYVH